MNRLLYFILCILISNTIFSQDVWITYTDSTTNLPDNKFSSILEDNNGDIWVGSIFYGLYKFENNDWTRFTSTNSGLISNFIQDLMVDYVGNTWIATADGISILDGTNFINFDTGNSALSADRVKLMGMNSLGEIYTTALDANIDGTGIDLYNSAGFSDAASIYPPDIFESRIHDWSFDSNDKLWIGSNEGMMTLAHDTFHVYTYSDMGTYAIYYNVICTEGDVYASSNSSLFKYNGIEWSEIDYLYLGIDPGVKIEEMMLDGKYIWIATSTQLVKYNTETNAVVKSYDGSNSPVADYKIIEMIKTSLGEYWFAAKDAVFRLTPEEEPNPINTLKKPSLKLTPNANFTSYNLSLVDKQEKVQVEIINAMGQLVSSKSYYNTSQLDIESVSKSGIYFVNVAYGNKKESFKIFFK